MGMGIWLKETLREKGMTIKQLSELSGVSLNTLYSITKRDSEKIDPVILKKISAITGTNGVTMQKWILATERGANSMTNADRIRAMSVDELALFLASSDFEQNRQLLESNGIVPTATQLSVLRENLLRTWWNWLCQSTKEEA